MPAITALLPAYNEEVSIGSVVLRTRGYADRVVVIDDGSSDHTAEVAALAGAEVLRHIKNQGKGAALKTELLIPERRCGDRPNNCYRRTMVGQILLVMAGQAI